MGLFLCSFTSILHSMKDMDESQHNPTLMVGDHKMVCPRCEVPRDILEYIPLDRPEKYGSELNPIYKCPKKRGGCSFMFSPSDEALDLVRKEMIN